MDFEARVVDRLAALEQGVDAEGVLGVAVDFVGVLSGPSSVLYGTGAIGGAVNVVPRRPDPTARRNEIQFGVGRFGTYHEAIDSTGPLSPRVSYRFDASLYNSDHWVQNGGSNRQAISGSLRVDATKTVTDQNTEEVKVRVIHSGVGAINESDVQLAMATKAKPTDNRVAIIGFNVVPEEPARA